MFEAAATAMTVSHFGKALKDVREAITASLEKSASAAIARQQARLMVEAMAAVDRIAESSLQTGLTVFLAALTGTSRCSYAPRQAVQMLTAKKECRDFERYLRQRHSRPHFLIAGALVEVYTSLVAVGLGVE
jgi:hypothetical protein